MSTPDEGRYSRVSRRMWNDERFRGLSQPKPSGGWLFMRLLTGPELSCIPGLFQAWQSGLADALRWPVKDLKRCWKEIADKKLAFADWDAGLVWLPNGIHHNEPPNPNVVLSWRTAWTELPECQLKADAEAVLREWCEERGQAWVKAFDEVTGREPRKGKRNGSGKGSPKQDQDQDQEPEQDQRAAAEIINLSGIQRAGANPEAAAATEFESPEIRKRAAYVLANKQVTASVDVGQWPECQALGIAVAQAFGQKWHGFGEYERDSALRAAVGLLARFDWPDLELAVDRAKTDSYFADTKRQGLSSFSLEVVRRLLATPRRAEERPSQQYEYFCTNHRLCRATKDHDPCCPRGAAKGAQA